MICHPLDVYLQIVQHEVTVSDKHWACVWGKKETWGRVWSRESERPQRIWEKFASSPLLPPRQEVFLPFILSEPGNRWVQGTVVISIDDETAPSSSEHWYPSPKHINSMYTLPLKSIKSCFVGPMKCVFTSGR